jgi:hypothetical protein
LNVSDAELEAELLRRKNAAVPQPLIILDSSSIKEMCVDYIKTIQKEGREPKDFKEYLYEEALKAVFGDDVFEWINEQDAIE